jgi:hypothetical protein
MNILKINKMHDYKMVFWSESKQRIRYTYTGKFDGYEHYDYIGKLTNAEFDVLLEALFMIYQDTNIELIEVKSLYLRLRSFFNEIKQITEEI